MRGKLAGQDLVVKSQGTRRYQTARTGTLSIVLFVSSPKVGEQKWAQSFTRLLYVENHPIYGERYREARRIIRESQPTFLESSWLLHVTRRRSIAALAISSKGTRSHKQAHIESSALAMLASSARIEVRIILVCHTHTHTVDSIIRISMKLVYP